MPRSSAMLALLIAMATTGGSYSPTSGAPAAGADARGGAAEQFALLASLEGEWRAPMGARTMVDVFRRMGNGSAVLHEEWLDGRQLTVTVFYLAGSELHADHFCDLGNQVRFVADPAGEPNVIAFHFRDAQNLDVFPRHFHGTTWRLEDREHLTQDWRVEERGKAPRVVRLEFTRTK